MAASLLADGRVIAYSHEVKPGYESEFGTFGIYRVAVDPDSVGTPELVVPISGARWLSFAPDNRRVVYAWNRDLWVADVFTKEVRRLTTDANCAVPHWHPNRDVVAYNRILHAYSPDSGGIRVIDVASLEDTPFRTRSGKMLYGGGPAWDPVGQSIIYTRYLHATGGLEVFRVYPDSSEEIQVTDLGWGCEYPKWVDGGRSIVVRISPGGLRDPDFPDWWIIPEAGGPARPFYDFENQIEVGSNMAVGPGSRQFVLTRPATGNEHWLALWVVGPGPGNEIRLRQITGP